METTDLIKEKLDIAEFVRQYVPLKQAGRNLKGLCPFHKEKSPSFIVSPDRQSWHCFGCGVGGDVISFVMKFENLEFIEALKILADRAGISLKLSGNQDQKQYDRLYEINRIAKDYFAATLREDMGKPAMKYLLSRGLKPETINEFEIGLAGPNADALTRHLTKLGYTIPDIERAGVSLKSERGMVIDRFRNRIMFPLFNHFGKVIAFTGRIMPEHEAEPVGKYVNSPETPIFNKSRLLFGLHMSKNFIRDAKTAVLVEGQMDFIMVWQDGVKNLAATSGTALTVDHLKVLRRGAENLVLSFDNDSAGQAAAERSIDLAESADFNVKVISFGTDKAKDPADIAKETPGKMAKLIESAIPAMEYYFHYYGIGKANEIGEKKKAVRLALSKIKNISSPVVREHWVNELSRLSGVSNSVLLSEMIAVKVSPSHANFENPDAKLAEPELLTRKDVISERILSLMLIDQTYTEKIRDKLAKLPDKYQKIFEFLVSDQKKTAPAELAQSINMIYLRSSLEPSDANKLAKEFDDLVANLSGEANKNERRQLIEEIDRAERAKNSKKVDELMEKLKNLTR